MSFDEILFSVIYKPNFQLFKPKRITLGMVLIIRIMEIRVAKGKVSYPACFAEKRDICKMIVIGGKRRITVRLIQMLIRLSS